MHSMLISAFVDASGNIVDRERRGPDLITIFKMAATHSIFEARTLKETWGVLLHMNFILVSFFDTKDHKFGAMIFTNQF